MKNRAIDHRTDADFGPLFSGELLRDEGIAQVSEHNRKWMELAIMETQNYISYAENYIEYPAAFTGEDIRFFVSKHVGCPGHSNAWGALINTLVRRKIIKPTGEYRAMRDDSSHARRTPVYTK